MTKVHKNLHLVDHPLIQHKLSYIRDRNTNSRDFRRLLSEIAALMTYEVCREFATVVDHVDTPLERTAVRRVVAPITIVPVLRAGLGMTRGVLDLLPEARIGHIGVRRDESTALPVGYYTKLPHDISAGPVILVDPMLATGGSTAYALTILREVGCSDPSWLLRRVWIDWNVITRQSRFTPPHSTANSTATSTSARASATQATAATERTSSVLRDRAVDHASFCHGVSATPLALFARRAIAKSRSLRRFKNLIGAFPTESASLNATSSRSARRQIVRAT